MQLPSEVRAVIENRAASVPVAELREAAVALSRQYRSGGGTRNAALAPEHRAIAYLVTRLPATHAAAHAVLRRVAVEPASLLDLGAGAGAAALAALPLWPALRVTAVEADAALLAEGRRLLPAAEWRRQDITTATLETHDVVVASYALGELEPSARDDTVRRAWKASRLALVIIEPGTMDGFARIRAWRALLLKEGARIAAPCPHESACPMSAPDWCHFAQRVERTALHRRLKAAELGHEDEKFSYLVAQRGDTTLAPGRIVRRPRHEPGLITLTLCTPEGIRTRRVVRSDKDRFRDARKALWGDGWPPP